MPVAGRRRPEPRRVLVVVAWDRDVAGQPPLERPPSPRNSVVGLPEAPHASGGAVDGQSVVPSPS
jgi:hypothetical protein